MLRVPITWTAGAGTPYYASLYYGGSTSGEATAAHNATAAFMDAMEPHTIDDLLWVVGSDVESVDPATGNVLEVFPQTETVHQGTVGSDGVPWASQALFRWRTGTYVNGREIRGRTFWPGIPEVTTVNGVLPSGVLTTFNGILTAHLGSVGSTAAGGRVVWSPTNGIAEIVNTATTWDQFAVLRTRRP